MARERETQGAAPPGSGVTVRAARPADVPRIWEMLLGLAAYERLAPEVSGTPERLAADLFGPRPPVECLVAESGGALVGYALVYATYSSFRTVPTLWLEDLFVTPAARGQGAGRALLAAAARRAIDRGCVGIGWIVLDWNRAAIEFYERVGARPAAGGWLEYGLDRAGLEALVAAAPPERQG